MSSLAGDLGRSLRWDRGRMRVAVLDFSTPHGDSCELSAPLAEELTTRLFYVDRFAIIERRMLNKVLRENTSGQSDLFDPSEVARLGRLMGADGIVTGTIISNEFGYTFDARIIVVESAEVVSVARTNMPSGIVEQRGTCSVEPVTAPPPAVRSSFTEAPGKWR
jgi:hypothetical protein